MDDKLEACHYLGMDGFFDWNQQVDRTQRHLPHWSQQRVIYFATFRLADSIPNPILTEWIERKDLWLSAHPEPHDEATQREYHRLFTWKFHDYLDRGHGTCLLADVNDSQIVADTMRYFNGKRYHLGEWVVMPNHVHVVFQTQGEWTLTQILHSWKSYSARLINQRREFQGQLWQHESYDRIVRSALELSRIEQYIQSNPEKAGLQVCHASWFQ